MNVLIRVVIITFIFITFSQNLYADCKKQKKMLNSTSCYCSFDSNDNTKWVIQFSMDTLKRLENVPGSASATIKNIKTILNNFNIESAAVIYSIKLANEEKEQDCRIYGVLSQGKIDPNNIIKESYTTDCIIDSSQFASRVAGLIDFDNDQHKLFSNSIIPGFDPSDNNASSSILHEKRNNLSFLIANSKVMRNAWWKGSDLQFVQYPMVAYTIKEGDSWWKIAKEKTDKGVNWATLWTVNSEKPGGMVIKANKQIYIPAQIKEWKTVDTKGKNYKELSKTIYGSEKFSKVVEQIMMQNENNSSHSFPIFSEHDSFKEVAFGNAEKLNAYSP